MNDSTVKSAARVVTPPLPEPPEPTAVRAPVNVRNVALVVLAVLATLYAMYWMRVVLIPLMLSLLVSFTLNPIVRGMARMKIPRVISATLVLSALVGGVGYLATTLHDEAVAMIDSVPEAVREVRWSLWKERNDEEEGMLEKVQQAATEIERVAEETGGDQPSEPNDEVVRVRVEQPAFDFRQLLWGGSLGAVALAGQLVVIVFLIFFFLVFGHTYKRKLVRMAGPNFEGKRMTVQIIDEFTRQIQIYLLVLLISGVFVGILTWLAFWWIEVNQAPLWGLIAGVASTIPYIGPAIVFVATSVAGLVQFGTINMGLFIGFVSLVITSIQGYVLTPWLTSKAVSLNAVAVFVAILLGGWLWGVWGVVLATPMLMMVKTYCDHIENLKPVGELLGG